MNIKSYFSEGVQTISYTRRQASTFAKLEAGDFNPLHDEDAKRFVVPGDLLFATLLSRVGLSAKLMVQFHTS